MATPIRDAAKSAITNNPPNPSKKPETASLVDVFGMVEEAIAEVESIAAAGIRWSQQPVRVRATGNVNISDAIENGDTLNGVALATGDVVLLPGQSSGATVTITLPDGSTITNSPANGFYTVPASGAASRSSFADSAAELSHIGVVILEGTTGSGERWTLPLDAEDITVDTTGLAFALTGIDEAVDAGKIASVVHAASSKSTPADADEIGLIDSADSNILKKLTWANLKATLKTYFDTLYTNAVGLLALATERLTIERTSASLDPDWAFPLRFGPAVAFGIRKRDGSTVIQSLDEPEIHAKTIAGDVYASVGYEPTGMLRLSYTGDCSDVFSDNFSAHYSREVGSVIRREVVDLRAFKAGRAFQTTLKAGIVKLHIVLCIGQSNGAGSIAFPLSTGADTPIDPERGIMFYGGARPLDRALKENSTYTYGADPDTPEVGRFAPSWVFNRTVGYAERQIGNTVSAAGETVGYGIVQEMLARLPSDEAVLFASLAVGGTPISAYPEDSAMDYNLYKAALYGRILADQLIIPDVEIDLVHIAGEQEVVLFESVAATKARIVDWYNNVAPRLKALQKGATAARNPHLFQYQLDTWTKINASITTSNVPEAQRQAARDVDEIHVVMPSFIVEHDAGGIHFTAASNRIRGQYGGRYIAAVKDNPATAETLNEIWLTAQSWVGTTLTLTFNAGGLSFITGTSPGQVSDPGTSFFAGSSHGVRLIPSGAAVTLSAAAVGTGPDTNKVSFTVDRAPGGGETATLDIAAYASVTTMPGPTTGPRSDIGVVSADAGFDARLLNRFVQIHKDVAVTI